MKSRIALGAAIAAAFVVLTLLVLLSMEETRAFFLQRASVTQDYDEGPDGTLRQSGALDPDAAGSVLGIRPAEVSIGFRHRAAQHLHRRLRQHGLDRRPVIHPAGRGDDLHRLSPDFPPLAVSPGSEVAFPALLVVFLQAFQIDVDHWRHFYLMLGLVWGLEAARQQWETTQQLGPAKSREPVSPPDCR